MHQRVHLLAGIAAVFASSIGCAMEKKESSPDPAANTDAPSAATATTTAAAVPAGDPDKSGAPVAPEKSGEGTAAPAPSADEPKTATKVTKGEKEVKTDGKDIELKNESGKGSVKKGPGGTTVTGKSGKSVTIPGL